MSTYKELTHEIFETIRKLRESPNNFASFIESTFPYYKSDNVLHRPGTIPLQTREGLKAAKELYDELIELESLPELEYSVALSSAAIQHCEDTGLLGIVGHIGSRETSLQKRVESFGKWSGNLVEALDYGSFSAIEVVFSLLVDDGLVTRPHRKALLNSNFTKIGVGAGPHSEFKTVVCVLFAVGYTEYDEFEVGLASESKVPENPKVDEWLEGAVKLTSEVKEETVNGEKVRKIKNHWEMRDGTMKVTDKIEKIEEPIVEKKFEKECKSSSSSSSDKKKKVKSSSSDSSSEKHRVEDIIETEPTVEAGIHHEEYHEYPTVHHVEHHETPTPHHQVEEHHERHVEVHHDVINEPPHHIEGHEKHVVEHHEKPVVEHHEKPVVEHHETEHHEKPVVEHHETEHHEKLVVEHHESGHHEAPHVEHKRKKSNSSSDSDKKKKKDSGSSSDSDEKKIKRKDSSDEDKKSSS